MLNNTKVQKGKLREKAANSGNLLLKTTFSKSFPCGSVGKESACNAGDLGLIPGLGRFPGGGHGTHSAICAWRIPTDRGAWQATFHEVAKLDMTE